LRGTHGLIRKVPGVGHLTALTFVLTLGSKERFKQSRDVGCYLGLRPRRSPSGDRDPQLGITKAGNVYLRSLLIECSGHILRPQGKDSSLRQWGLHLASRGGSRLGIKLWLLWHASWPSCSIASGSRKSRTCPSARKLHKR
jgi:transposase